MPMNIVEQKIFERTGGEKNSDYEDDLDEDGHFDYDKKENPEKLSYRFSHFIDEGLVKNWPQMISYPEEGSVAGEECNEELDAENIGFSSKGEDYVIYWMCGDWQPPFLVTVVISKDPNFEFEIVNCSREP